MASTISFKKKPVAAPTDAAPTAVSTPQQNPTPTAAPAAALVAAPAAAPVATTAPGLDYGGVGGFEGEFTSRDMKTPYMSLFQKTSTGFEENPSWLGHWVYDREVVLGKSVKVVFLRAAKFYVEKTEFKADIMPQRFVKMQDARAAGFNEGSVQEVADLDLLIEVDAAAEGVSDLAHIFVGDKAYILARYSVRSSSYGRTVGILAKDSAGFLKGNLINGFYTMNADSKAGAKGTYFVPTLKTAGPTSEALRIEIIERMGADLASAS